MSLIFRCVLVMLAICCWAGCVRLGRRLEPITLPPGAPAVSVVLDGLAANETALTSFRATGTVVLEIPEVEATQISRESTLYFRYPNQLYVIGRRYGTRVIELTYAKDAFLLEFPTRREYCLRLATESFNTLTSADIVREMFTPEPWESLPEDLARLSDYDEATQTATIEIWTRDPRLRLKRLLLAQGAPWVILESQLLDKQGRVIAHTLKNDYHEQESIRYPTRIETLFPGEDAWMRFTMRRVDVNAPVEDNAFDVIGKAEALERRGFHRVDIFAGEGPDIEDLTAGS
ncbi:MAG TPA: hypothetical protein ENN29_06910 [Candidatus Hydrogenedentes bacterium]|nr:hypothetical protein [Candidatus Hydrogenedentota bacterium]